MTEPRSMRRADDVERIAAELASKILQEAETKRIFKEALTEWLDHKYAVFGRWSLAGLGALGLTALVVFIMWSQGYRK